MSSQIQIGVIRVASITNSSGIFSGQNLQCDWDSHALNISAIGGSIGDYDRIDSPFTYFGNYAEIGQPVYDEDIKFTPTHLWTDR